MEASGFEVARGVPMGGGARPIYVLGPCVVESEEMVLEVARVVRDIGLRHSVPVIFKASFDKANRSSLSSYRGPGIEAGMAALARVKEEIGLPVLTDVHEPDQAERAAEIADVLQVPAFLCRQTDLLLACGRSRASVNVKKGQFMAPDEMANVVEKVRSTGNHRVSLTERGTSFGYHNLVVDVRAFPIMRRFAPVLFDITHSLQLPGGLGHASGGEREFHAPLARAVAAVGVDGFYAELHPEPARALSDAATQLSPEEADRLVGELEELGRVLWGRSS